MAVTTTAAVPPAQARDSYPWILIGLLWLVAVSYTHLTLPTKA